tara:strand:- start:502 stop:645 length:144 start_codon:yes stop_codon:yes gene_type:complete
MARQEKTEEEKRFIICIADRLVALRKKTHDNYEKFAYDKKTTKESIW